MPSGNQPNSYIKLGLIVLFLVFLVLISALVFPGSKKDVKGLISPEFFQAINLTSTFSFAFKSEGLSKIVGDNLAGKQGDYAIYIEDLSDGLPAARLPAGQGRQGENYSLRSLDTFPAASLYKVFLMAAVLAEVDKGNLGLDQTISSNIDHLVEVYGSVDFGYEGDEGDIKYTVEEALTRVGRISDNFAAIMLMDKVGTEKVQAVADSIGATSTSFKAPITTTAEDTGKFFRALYSKELISPFVSEKVTEFLSLNQLNNRIPAFAEASAGKPALEGVRIIHKTGELAGVRHDAGIVYLATKGENLRAYVVVLMSKDLRYEDEGVETLAKISKDVYEYFRDKSLK